MLVRVRVQGTRRGRRRSRGKDKGVKRQWAKMKRVASGWPGGDKGRVGNGSPSGRVAGRENTSQRR